MRLELSMNMDDAAFTPCPGIEAARILRECATRLNGPLGCCYAGGGFKLLDINGNIVGRVDVLGDAEAV